MCQSFFFAVVITFCFRGAEGLTVDEAVLAESSGASGTIVLAEGAINASGRQREIKTREWMPWSFLITGSVIIIYTFTLPRRFQQ